MGIGLGTWHFDDESVQPAVREAFKIGYRHIDTAADYGCQKGIGQALNKLSLPRDQYFITSKTAYYGSHNLNASAFTMVLNSCLEELQVEYVDLMLIHVPASTAALRKEQWLALEAWAKAGKARAIGVSHYCRYHLEEVLSFATLPVALNQNQYHIGMAQDSQPRLHDKAFAESKGIVYMSYSTLCGPCPPPGNSELLTGELVTSIGAQYNKTGAQISLRWPVQQGVPVVPMSRNPQHLKSNFELFDFELNAEDMARLNAASTPPETGTVDAPVDAQDCAAEVVGASGAAELTPARTGYWSLLAAATMALAGLMLSTRHRIHATCKREGVHEFLLR